EAFGAAWESLDAVAGEELWREVGQAPAGTSPSGALNEVAKPWGLAVKPLSVGPVDAAERLVVVGPSAVVALAELFVASTGLDWAVQVMCIATPPAHRQVALSALAVVDAHKPGRVLSARDALPDLRAMRVVRSD